MNSNGVVMLTAQRPHWWRSQSDITLDCRAVGPDRPPLIKSVLETAELLGAGQTLSFRLDYQPALLCRILEQKGFKLWSEPEGDGEWRIDVCASSARVL